MTLACIIYLIYQIRVPIVIGESEWCLMAHKIINYLTTIILPILFLLARWPTNEMHSKSPPKFPIATDEWTTAKRTHCDGYTNCEICKANTTKDIVEHFLLDCEALTSTRQYVTVLQRPYKENRVPII